MHPSAIDFQSVRVLVVGDLMLDRYIWGKVRRISPEAPVPVVQLQQRTESLGGAGNVAANLAGLGCAAEVIGVCGDDATAQSLRALLAREGIVDRMMVDPTRPTITKTRIMAQKQQILRLDEEVVGEPPQPLHDALMAAVESDVGRCQAVILSDYGKGLLSGEPICQAIIAAARRHAVPVLVDPKGANWLRYRGATCMTPNTAELEGAVGAALEEDEAALIAAARDMRGRLALDHLLVTRGARGMCLIGPGDQETLIAARAREVYDVSGAGDTVIATLAGCLATGMEMPAACATANLAAGIVVGKLGTQPVLLSELRTALQFDTGRHNFPFSAAKMADLPAALARVREWKAAGAKVVFTNGCFDLLHPGHISLLYQARALGDRLVVGLNTDASVRRLKGAGRPILGEQDRAAMLSALTCVDMVVHFDQPTPLALISALRPDVLVKGADYTVDQVVGREVVEAYGGCVKLVDVVQGYSTTGLTRKVLAGSHPPGES